MAFAKTPNVKSLYPSANFDDTGIEAHTLSGSSFAISSIVTGRRRQPGGGVAGEVGAMLLVTLLISTGKSGKTHHENEAYRPRSTSLEVM
jgi:hypothetical protein